MQFNCLTVLMAGWLKVTGWLNFVRGLGKAANLSYNCEHDGLAADGIVLVCFCLFSQALSLQKWRPQSCPRCPRLDFLLPGQIGGYEARLVRAVDRVSESFVLSYLL